MMKVNELSDRKMFGSSLEKCFIIANDIPIDIRLLRQRLIVLFFAIVLLSCS
jgi:hypothetical protein